MNEVLDTNNEELNPMKARLKRAVAGQAPPPYLEARIRNHIRTSEEPRHFSWRTRTAPLAAAVAVCLGIGIAYQLGHLRWTASSQDAYIASVSNRVATLMRVGLRDHIHCSIFRKYPKEAPKVEALAANLGPAYKNLLPILRSNVPSDFKAMIAHECGYKGRKFIHVSLKSDSQLLSLVIARKQDGESFQTDEMIPALQQAGIPFYRSGAQRFQIASFEATQHLVYLISDLPSSDNLRLLVAMAPQVKSVLER
jgi:hypothetical protein